ncbi:MAG: hypothetical protein M1833_001077 [Piccolia ochrophora]|nr:MAG: hypothetical protein M1833_001077 [Piccolia ochrophora]
MVTSTWNDDTEEGHNYYDNCATSSFQDGYRILSDQYSSKSRIPAGWTRLRWLTYSKMCKIFICFFGLSILAVYALLFTSGSDGILVNVIHSNYFPASGWSHAGDTHRGNNLESMPALHRAKPKGIKVVALIFYGRPDRVEILDCYVKRNLAENGGYLDEVRWIANTEDTDKLRFLDEYIIPSTPLYKKISLAKLGFGSMWDSAVENNTMYIKIDDDVVWFAEDAIPELVHSKMTAGEKHYVVSANIINNPLMGWVHYHAGGAVHPYLPELEQPVNKTPPSSWRASSQPQWSGPDDYEYSLENAPPYSNHRWLRLANNEMLRTPASKIQYDPFGTAWSSWAIAAQQHASLLENLENDQLELYKTTSQMWDLGPERMSINFMALWGEEIRTQLPIPEGDDEHYFTVDVPMKLKKTTAVNTHALAAHFAFFSQVENLEQTDLLARYKAYADEFVCKR